MTLAMFIWWILFGVPLVAILVGWVVLCSRWRLETHHLRALTAMVMATAPAVLANCSYVCVDFVRPEPSSDYTLERIGLLVSAVALVTAAPSAKCAQRWISILTGSVSAYMFVLYFLVDITG
jgi:hypothetical protein